MQMTAVDNLFQCNMKIDQSISLKIRTTNLMNDDSNEDIM